MLISIRKNKLFVVFLAVNFVFSCGFWLTNRTAAESSATERFDVSSPAQTTKLTAADGMTNHRFGTSIAVSGNTAVVGAPQADAAYIFVRNGAVWTQEARLAAAGGEFGYSVAIEGNTVVVAARYEPSPFGGARGAVYVFARSSSTWTQQARFSSVDSNQSSVFGTSVDISGDRIIVGMPSISSFGMAFIYVNNGSGWVQQSQILASDPANSDMFGASVGISGETVVVGAYGRNLFNSQQNGAVHIYKQNGGVWSHQIKFSGSEQGDQLGTSVAIEQDTIIVGAAGGGTNVNEGTAYFYERTAETWTQRQQLLASDGGTDQSRFGNSLAFDGNNLIIGAHQRNVGTQNAQGAAYVFEKTGTLWSEKAKLFGFDGRQADYFGTGVAVTGDTFLIGAPQNEVGANFDQGAVYVFDNPTNAPDLQTASDSGVSGSDNLTNNRAPVFDISGVAVNATVELLKNDTVIDSAVAPTGGLISLRDTNPPADGRFVYTARQTFNGQIGSQSAPLEVVFDTTAPVVNINQSQTNDPTNTQPVNFRAIFSEVPIGFSQSDISLSGSTANVSAANVSIVINANTNYVVVVGNILSDGVIRASIPAGVLTDAAGNSNQNSVSTDNTITLDLTAPTVTINQAANQADPTNTLPVVFDVVFSEPVTDMNGFGVISLAGSSANVFGATISVTGSGANYTVSIGNITSNGQFVRASIRTNAVRDAAGNLNAASTSTDNTVTVDNVRPTVTVNQAGNQADPTSTQPVNFTVAFSEAVTNFDAADLSLASSTANVSAATITVSGNGSIYNVAVANILSSGQVRASVAANAAQDASGNLSSPSTSTDNTVTYSLRRGLSDFDADGKADISVFRPENGTWYIQQSTAGFTGISFGIASDKLTPADYDGDGKTDVAVFRSGIWYLLRSQLGFTDIQFGAAGDIPAPADYDGDGKADLALFRPANGTWYLQQSTNGFAGVQFGQNGDKPVAADYDGDGKFDLAVNRNGVWYIQRSQLGFTGLQFGDANDKLVPADYDGDGKADVAVYRPSNGTWYLQQSTTGFVSVQFGANGDAPSPADYDGDGKTDVAVFRSGIWYLNRSTQGFTGVAFGAAGDQPVPNAFVP